MAAQLSSLSSIQTSNETAFDKQDEVLSIRSFHDSDLDSEDELDILYRSDLDSAEEADVPHISYREQMKYFERHEDPPVAKEKCEIKEMTKFREGTDDDPERVVFKFPDLSMTGEPSELCKLQRKPPDEFMKLADDFLESQEEQLEPQPSQAVIEATAQYEALIDKIRKGDTEYKRLRAELKELRKELEEERDEPREHSLFGAGNNPLSIDFRIVQQPLYSFDMMAYLTEPMDDDEFDDMIDAFYDGVYGRRLIRRPPVLIDLTGDDDEDTTAPSQQQSG